MARDAQTGLSLARLAGYIAPAAIGTANMLYINAQPFSISEESQRNINFRTHEIKLNPLYDLFGQVSQGFKIPKIRRHKNETSARNRDVT